MGGGRRTGMWWAVVIGLVSPMAGRASAPARALDPPPLRAIGRVALPFVPNAGQWDDGTAFAVRTPGGGVAVGRDGTLRYRVRGAGDVAETFVAGVARPVAGAASTARTSRFVGADPARWQRDLTTWDSVRLGAVWPGVAVEVIARGAGVEKVFTIAPGVAPERIRLKLHGARTLVAAPDGGLRAHTADGVIALTAPVAWQDVEGARRPVEVAYAVRGRSYGFRLGAYDRTRPVVVDPILRATFLGGASSDDEASDLAIHPTTGEVIVVGSTQSDDFPGTTGGAQPENASSNNDAFVARFSADLSTLLQATYFGGTGAELGTVSVAIHPTSGDVYVAGETASADLPGVTAGTGGTGNGAQIARAGTSSNLFVARFTDSLQGLVQATYLGGDGVHEDPSIAIHPTSGDVYVAGRSSASDFPGTAGGATSSAQGGDDAVVARLAADLQSLAQASYFGGTSNEGARAIAIHPTSGDVYLYGTTESPALPATAGGAMATANSGFVTRLNAALTSHLQSSFLPNTFGNAIALAPATDDVYVIGGAISGVPATDGGFQSESVDGSDAWILRLSSSLTTAKQGTYLGGSGSDGAASIAIGAGGDVFVSATTDSDDMPGVTNGAQATYGGGFDEVYVARLNAGLTALVQATYFGNTGEDTGYRLVLHPTTGDVYVTGTTNSETLPGTAGAPQTALSGEQDGFVVRLSADLSDSSVTSTSTTIPGGGTTTTTLPGAGCVGLAPLATVACRVDALQAAVGAASGLGKFQAKLLGKLAKAQSKVAQAETSCAAGDAKKTRKAMKKTAKQAGAVAKTLGSRGARKNVDATVREPLHAEATAIKAAAKTVAQSPSCPE